MLPTKATTECIVWVKSRKILINWLKPLPEPWWMRLFCVIIVSSYAGMKRLFCNCSAPACSSQFLNKCICNTEHYALDELLLAQTICFSFAKARVGMKNHSRVLPEISRTQLWKQTELIVFSCSGKGVPFQCTGLQGSQQINPDPYGETVSQTVLQSIDQNRVVYP